MTENEATQHASADPVEPVEPEGNGEADGPAVTSADAEDTVESPQGPAREITTESVVEAVLFASDTPLPAAKLAQIVGVGDAREMKKHVAALNKKYETSALTFRIEEIAGGFRMLTLPEYNTWLTKLSKARSESKLSQAALETLAVVAYKQPVLRADVEAIRGVSVGDMLNRLREFGLVKIVGRAEELGRPMLYGTTKRFLEVFGLADLDELPQVEELRQPGA
ncbi:MAG: SMC-Scp complex subunit ScpB [Phycisphaerae bacterium]|nr:SMC-Scp complex subunit ScpB [Phycisphaerae bacterium]